MQTCHTGYMRETAETIGPPPSQPEGRHTMSEATAVVESEATEAEETTQAPATQSKLIEWDSAKASAEDASVDQKLLDHVIPLHNKLVEIVAKYQAVTDSEAAVEEYGNTSDDPEIVAARELVEKANKMIEKQKAIIAEKARAAVLESIDPEFDEAKVKALYNDTKVELKKNASNVRDTFKLLGFVEAEVSPAGRESNWKALKPQGELLLKALDFPKLEGAKESAGGASEAVKEFNRNAKEWARNNGMKVADKGALSTEVKEAYSKATGIAIP